MTSRYPVWLLFVFAYVFLDWASYIHALPGVNITPWNPAPAASLLFLMRVNGLRGWLVQWLAILLAECLVRGLPASWLALLVHSAVLAAGYALVARWLARHFPSGRIFVSRDGLMLWGGAVILGTLVNGVVHVGLLTFFGLLPPAGWGAAMLRFWVGDGVGILVMMPLFWMLADGESRRVLVAWLGPREAASFAGLVAASLLIAFGLGGESHFIWFYLLFLPVIWAAARHGLAAAVFAAAVVQAGVIVAVLLSGLRTVTVFELQMLALALALVGFFIGVVVDEQRRAAEDLRQTLHLAAAGEMAGALAHELNQPLTALAAYGKASQLLLAEGDAGRERLASTVQRMVAEAARAADVVRRLREFFRSGTLSLEVVRLGVLLAEVEGRFREQARRDGIEFVVTLDGDPLVLADPVQIEVVLRNLIDNAFAAAGKSALAVRRVDVSASASLDSAMVTVSDSGAGVDAEQAGRVFEPFSSTKAAGMGLGLAVSRAIVEAHGGALDLLSARPAVFRLRLPLHEVAHAPV